ncbi:deoxyribose-phosphate aldolase [Salicibibacter halophilus]|uniref:Deoxyribose-phosphate aldolase n=1 Tax=Salicibibacter halophilus TaxID=2502791 RepID=A0A514LH76_9BACI|nr:deoxyribose-phosphate aldolase [Salicibibacter halophilus]QDI91189.1 deoxyribose-phosphate aldolase [Salicibibacter halophilus]
MKQTELAAYIDHTLLKPEATKTDILTLCDEAKEHRFATVCIPPYWVKTAVQALEGSDVGVATVIGFPHGMNVSEIKAFETEKAIEQGASDVDMVINAGALKSGDEDGVRADIDAVVKASGGRALVKVIIETSRLTEEEKKTATRLAVEAGADYVKTSTGFHTAGATLADIKLMKEVAGEKGKLKASGGVKTAEDAKAYIEAGTDRIGTSSGIAIVTGDGGSGAY